MIIVDTSVWADHFRNPAGALAALILSNRIAQHPFVTSELALGNPRDRGSMVAMLEALHNVQPEKNSDLLQFVEQRELGGTGIGFVDAHLLASSATNQALLWTRDKRLQAQAERLGLAYNV